MPDTFCNVTTRFCNSLHKVRNWLVVQGAAGTGAYRPVHKDVDEGIDIGGLIETAAVELLASRMKTPLQIEQHLTLAFEEAFRFGERPVTVQVVESILSRQRDDLEPRPTRHGCGVRSLADRFSAKPAEIRQFLRGELGGVRAQERTQQMQAAGLPL